MLENKSTTLRKDLEILALRGPLDKSYFSAQIFESSSSPQVEDVPVKTVILGEAYIKRRSKAGKPDRFVCLIGETGKVFLTFFTAN